MRVGETTLLGRHQAVEAAAIEAEIGRHSASMAVGAARHAVIPRRATRTCRATTLTQTRQRRPGRRAGVVAATDIGERGFRGQLIRRTNPQMVQVAIPVTGSSSRKLGHPLVPQNSFELTAAAVERRRIRRIAEARPVRDEVVDRVIMCESSCAFWGAVIAR
jgi:hypothetical protein